jgi:hypothetical protein
MKVPNLKAGDETMCCLVRADTSGGAVIDEYAIMVIGRGTLQNWKKTLFECDFFSHESLVTSSEIEREVMKHSGA